MKVYDVMKHNSNLSRKSSSRPFLGHSGGGQETTFLFKDGLGAVHNGSMMSLDLRHQVAL